MIHFAFNRPDITGPHNVGIPTQPRERWHVVHPSNGAIIARCDTKTEADALCGLFAGLRQLCEEGNIK